MSGRPAEASRTELGTLSEWARQPHERPDSVAVCKANGWAVGTRLRRGGDGCSTIEITALGERRILAKCIDGPCCGHEGPHDLTRDDWQV